MQMLHAMKNFKFRIFIVLHNTYPSPFPSSLGYKYILVMVDYVSKLVEEIPTITNDVKVIKKMLMKIIFPRFGTP